MYRDEVGRVLRLKLEDECGNRDNKKGGEGKGGTRTPPSTAENVTSKYKRSRQQPRPQRIVIIIRRRSPSPSLLGRNIRPTTRASLEIL